jgi:DNA-binding MarR family transcriptional regulator
MHWKRDGLITRQPNPADRRERLFRLTDTGQDTLAQATTIIDDLHQRLADRIGQREKQELDALLTITTSSSAVQ